MALLPLLEAVVAELEGTAEGTCSAGVEDPQPMVSGLWLCLFNSEYSVYIQLSNNNRSKARSKPSHCMRFRLPS